MVAPLLLAAAGAAPSIINGIFGAFGARDSARAQRRALNQGNQAEEDAYNKNASLAAISRGQYDPYAAAGAQGLAGQEAIANGNNQFGRSYADYTKPDPYSMQKVPTWQGGQYSATPFTFDANSDPGAQFRKNEALKAVSLSALSKGALNSGATAKALQDRASNLGAQQYENAFNNNLQTNQQNLAGFQTNFNDYASDRNSVVNQNQFGVQQNENARDFGYKNYRDDYTDYMKQLQDKYSRFGDLTKIGQYGTDNQEILDQNTRLANANRADRLANFYQGKGSVDSAMAQIPGNLAKSFTTGAMEGYKAYMGGAK